MAKNKKTDNYVYEDGDGLTAPICEKMLKDLKKKFEDLSQEEQKKVLAEIEERENILDGDGIRFDIDENL